MAGSHAILSPSSAHRWLMCTPSARFEEQIPGRESPYAAEGSLAHEVAAHVLLVRSGQRVDNGVPAELTNHELYTPEMYDHAVAYADYVMAKGGNIWVECTYDLARFVPQGSGTADATNFTAGTIHVTDYKYGAGVRVSATGNKQLMLYALGALVCSGKNFVDTKTVTMSIFQPRVGGVSTWELPVNELLDWAKNELAPKAVLAIAGAGDFAAGDHCRFCKAHTRCAAFYETYSSVRGMVDKRTISDEQRREVLTSGKAVATWIKAMEEDALNRLLTGVAVPGFKLVEGRGKRAFKSEDDVVDLLLGEGFDSDRIFDSKLRSLTALEKELGTKAFKSTLGELIIQVPGNPQIAPDDDSRPTANSADAYD